MVTLLDEKDELTELVGAAPGLASPDEASASNRSAWNSATTTAAPASSPAIPHQHDATADLGRVSRVSSGAESTAPSAARRAHSGVGSLTIVTIHGRSARY